MALIRRDSARPKSFDVNLTALKEEMDKEVRSYQTCYSKNTNDGRERISISMVIG